MNKEKKWMSEKKKEIITSKAIVYKNTLNLSVKPSFYKLSSIII